MTTRRIVIVGASLAGGTCALTLREEGFDGELLLVGAETQLPYHRPPLSKGYLRGEERFQDQLLDSADRYARDRIESRLGVRAISIDIGQRAVQLEGGENLAYDRLLLATGARNRKPPVPGIDMQGVYQLRTVDECDRIKAAALPGAKAVVVGLGFIGSEVTASLRQLGVEVTAIEGLSAPLLRVLGQPVGEVLAGIHLEHGVELALSDSVAAFEGEGRLERVRTASGRTIECDFAVAGLGVTPNSELAAEAGAAVENGLLVDGLCRTSIPYVYAAGDVTNHLHPVFGRIRVEHWNNAYNQGKAAAASMLGKGEPYGYVHSFWSDQYEHSLQYVGFATSWDEFVVRGSLEERRFLGFYLEHGRLKAVMGLNRGGDPEDPDQDGELKTCVPLIRDQVVVDPLKLADENVGLESSASL